MNPFPKNLAAILKSYDKVLIPELNTGQLRLLIRGNFLNEALSINAGSATSWFTIFSLRTY